MMNSARVWLRLLSFLVPGEVREEWLEEWTAELEANGNSTEHVWRALPDAWYLRTDGWTMDGMLRDVRYAVRSLIRKPFFTALAGITLAIGIGANTAIFSVVDAVIINPLPFPDSDRLVSLNHMAPSLGVPVVPHSPGTFLHYDEHLNTVESFAVFNDDNVNLIQEGVPQRLQAAQVTARFFDVLGVPPFIGRGFVEGEHFEGAEPVAVLAYATWQQTFGGDRAVVGQTVEMDGVRRRIVGIAPEGLDFPSETELWIPMSIDPTDPDLGNFGLIGIARLAENATVESANTDMQNLLLRFSDEHPEELGREIIEQAGFAADVKPLKDLYVQDVSQILWVLLGTVGFVLLIACANVANLFLVRAEARQRELGLRTALGATRGDIVRQFLAESVTLAVGAGLLGLGLAIVGVQGLMKLAPVAIPRAGEVGIDGSVLVFTAVIAVGSGLLFGLLPAFGYGRSDLTQGMKEGGRSASGGREQHRVRSGLVVAQVALALILLVGSGLMLRSFVAMRDVDPGFSPEDRLAFRVSLPSAEYPDAASATQFHREILERMAGIPGVLAVGSTSALPLSDQKNAGPMEAEDNPVAESDLGTMVDRRAVSPGYFAAMEIGLAEGRELTWDDGADAFRGVVVNETLARTFWPDGSALGRRIRSQGADFGWEVVGIAADVRFEEVQKRPNPLVYMPFTQDSGGDEFVATRSVDVVLHVGSDPMAFIDAAREGLKDVDSRIPMVAPRTVQSVFDDSMATTSFTVVLLGIAAGIALMLSTVGIYGVISYVVSRRTKEIGIRLALGAPMGVVLRNVVGQGMVLTGMGLVIGLLGAWGVSRVLASLLYGVSSTDPLTYVGTAAVLAVVALLATWIPARRAATVDPVEALRSE